LPLDLNWVFYLHSTDVDFPNYTQWEVPPRGQAWYSNNLQGGQQPEKFELLPLQGDRFSVDFTGQMPPQPSASRSLELRHLNGKLALSQTYFTQPSNPLVPLDLRALPDGGYQLSVTIGEKTLSYSFLKWVSKTPNGFGSFFEWYSCLNPTQPSPIAADQTYTFSFQARETYWQYFLVKKNGIPLRDATISPVHFQGRTVNFQPASEEVTLPNGMTAVEFDADGTLPFQERPEMNVQLEASGLAKGMRLPNASPELLYPAKSATELSSRIYVYL
jgi:hypothetical protein